MLNMQVVKGSIVVEGRVEWNVTPVVQVGIVKADDDMAVRQEAHQIARWMQGALWNLAHGVMPYADATVPTPDETAAFEAGVDQGFADCIDRRHAAQ